MKRVKLEPKDRTYVLRGDKSPLSYFIASKDTPRKRLLHFDEESNTNKPLRYARNSNSPFQEDQDANVILEPIVFEDGTLVVSKTNPVLQEFLHYHPLNGIVFSEVDEKKEAGDEVEDMNVEIDALIAARELSIDQIETLTRVMFGKDPSVIPTEILKRDILVYAKTEPREFLNILNDPELQYQAKVRLFFENRLLALRNNDREVWFNTSTNKKKMLSIPFGEDPYEMTAHFLQSDEGLDALKMLEAILSE
jgi:hypothetical protein